MCGVKKFVFTAVALFAAILPAQQSASAGAGQGAGARYATDAYPGFESIRESDAPSRKEPRWFAFLNGPSESDAAGEFAYCARLESEGRWSKAAKHYDALVREWPASAEAPAAQRRLAEILLEKDDDAEGAFEEYKYLVDFYSFRCDYGAAVDRMYDIANVLRMRGKTVMFFRFKNTEDVRRAYERCVLLAPGAAWAPAAMLTIGALREEEGHDAEAVKVYENLRNLHRDTPEARDAAVLEAAARMRLLREHGYNRERCLETIDFLKSAVSYVNRDDVPVIECHLADAKVLLEDGAYQAALFYDSRMRTKRSAVSAYERFLAEFPNSVRADDVRARLAELKGEGKVEK